MDREYCVNFEPRENEELKLLIERYARREDIPQGTYYVKPGDILREISYLYAGQSAHTMFNGDGQEKLSYILTDGWFLAEGLFSDGADIRIAERYSWARTPLPLYRIDRNVYRTLIEKPVFRNALINSISAKRAYLQRELESVILERTKDRLKKLFIMLSDPSSSADGEWYPLSHDYYHRDIASIIGSNRVTVSRFVSELAQDGFLRVVNKRIQVSKDHITDM